MLAFRVYICRIVHNMIYPAFVEMLADTSDVWWWCLMMLMMMMLFCIELGFSIIWTGAEVLPSTTTAVVAFSVRSIKDYSCLLLGMPVIVPQCIQTIRTSQKHYIFIQSNFTTSKSISKNKWLSRVHFYHALQPSPTGATLDGVNKSQGGESSGGEPACRTGCSGIEWIM